MELKVADGEAREPETRGPGTAGVVAEWMEEGSEEDEEDEDEEEGWMMVSKGIGECERAGAVRSIGGKEEGEGPKVTRGLRVTEVVIGRREGGRGEAERAAAVGREEELEEEGGEMERGVDSWVVYVCVCVYVGHAQKIAKLFFSVRSTQFPF